MHYQIITNRRMMGIDFKNWRRQAKQSLKGADCKDYIFNLCEFRKNEYSQYGESGIIDRLLFVLGIDFGWCCEVGAWDGRVFSNTFHLIEKGWNGIYIENDPNKFKLLEKTALEYPTQLVVYDDTVKDQLDEILGRTNIPKEFAVLSIDTDTHDYEIWDTLRGYKPKIVIMEDGNQFEERKELGESKGYKLVVYTGNMIFVADEYIP